jgi:hypothetical protein
MHDLASLVGGFASDIARPRPEALMLRLMDEMRMRVERDGPQLLHVSNLSVVMAAAGNLTTHDSQAVKEVVRPLLRLVLTDIQKSDSSHGGASAYCGPALMNLLVSAWALQMPQVGRRLSEKKTARIL